MLQVLGVFSLRLLFCVQELYANILLHIFYCGPS